jgi:hypothetical protein
MHLEHAGIRAMKQCKCDPVSPAAFNRQIHNAQCRENHKEIYNLHDGQNFLLQNS